MSVSKKSSKKTKERTRDNKKIYYAFALLFLANLIVFAFFGFFVFKLYANQITPSLISPVKIATIPKINETKNLNVSAVSYIVYDPQTRSIVFSKNHNLRLSPASSIKILTALVALENYELNEYLRAYPAGFDESKMGLYLGEEISVEDLLYGLLLISGNDAAKTLALNFPGGEGSFVTFMNNKARELELVDSIFFDPSGYMDDNYSTAFELSRLAASAMQSPVLREIVGTREKVVYDRNFTTSHNVKNLNELLSEENVTGIKTGFTNEAGGVLITSYIHKERELIIVVMKSKDRFADTRMIIDEIEKSVTYSDVISD